MKIEDFPESKVGKVWVKLSLRDGTVVTGKLTSLTKWSDERKHIRIGDGAMSPLTVVNDTEIEIVESPVIKLEIGEVGPEHIGKRILINSLVDVEEGVLESITKTYYQGILRKEVKTTFVFEGDQPDFVVISRV